MINILSTRRDGSANIEEIICAVVFCAFSFVYLYYYQGDLLMMQQHVLSNGLTSYNCLIGASIITICLQLVQVFINKVFCRKTKYLATTYFLPIMLLTILTDVSPNIDCGYELGKWSWLAPLLTIAYIVGNIVCTSFSSHEEDESDKTEARAIWQNLLIMTALFLFSCSASNTDTAFHNRMKIERYICQNDFLNALTVGKQSLETDSSTTMLRIYSLSAIGKLGDHLFEYNLMGGSDAMLPNGRSVKTMMYPATKIYKGISNKATIGKKPLDYLRWIDAHKVGKKTLADYTLCAYLLDKDIDGFAKAYKHFNESVAPTLPKHYKEALVLYNHLRSMPLISYHDEVAEADFQDFQGIIKSNLTQQEKRSTIKKTYGNTYWYYYLYAGK